ncbi:hypothetical protein TH5_22710 [Thalassospira xianhensis MCCC 1A02616]|uniref:Methyltransferase FkbM domain-containing protein n=1 Tax=Thalassospira xianhensis MCCC 1A02616 TaxID=1177929 RepID=A0A367U6M1_9PROT|nr:hypothetical protein TH5_22710 [Thalassospira xianhensis MCCC 1A02616]
MNNQHLLNIIIKYTGILTLKLYENEITFDMSMRHERQYALRILFECRIPQADIDLLLFQKFIKPGDYVLDAGANIGITAIEALSCGASMVLCIEPEPTLAARLRKISNKRIEVHECALSHSDGVAELYISSPHNQGHTIDLETRKIFDDIFGSKTQQVATKSIQSLLDGRHCNVWKLDIEGAEVAVIEAAMSQIKISPPRIIIAEVYGNNLDKMLMFLSEYYHCNRAAIMKGRYTLTLLPPENGRLSIKYEHTSPMYVFQYRD